MTPNNAFERTVRHLAGYRRSCGWLTLRASWPAAQLGRIAAFTRRGANWLMFLTVLGASMPGSATEASGRPWDCVAGRTTESKAPARLKPSEVIALASAAAKKRGYDLAKIRQSSICFDASHKRASWTVFFDVRDGVPVSHFRIWVRDDTGAAKLMPGE